MNIKRQNYSLIPFEYVRNHLSIVGLYLWCVSKIASIMFSSGISFHKKESQRHVRVGVRKFTDIL